MRLLKKNTAVGLVVLSLFVSACGTTKVMVMHQAEAAQAEAEGNYAAATESWNKYFGEQTAKGNEIAAENYARAAKSALKAERNDLAESWIALASAQGFTDPELQLDLATIYREKNELPKELSTLEAYRGKYDGEAGSVMVNARLFDLYTMMNNDAKASEIWPDLSDADRQKEEYLDEYFRIQLHGDDDAAKDSVAAALLKVNPKHVKALEWLGERYYRKAETSYKQEMKAYEKTHTQAQYALMLQALKGINANFQKSLDYFSSLWELEQKSTYASYLANIYTRFNNSSKAGYYKQFITK